MRDFFLRMLDKRDPTISSGIFLSVTTVLTILYTWAWVSIWAREIKDIPTGVWTFAAIVVTGKVAGMFADKPVVGISTSTSTETMTKTTEEAK